MIAETALLIAACVLLVAAVIAWRTEVRERKRCQRDSAVWFREVVKADLYIFDKCSPEDRLEWIKRGANKDG